MERVKKLENSTEESLGIEETVCMKSVVRNWRDPTHHRKVKRKRISLRNRISDGKPCEGEPHARFDDRRMKFHPSTLTFFKII